MTDREKTLRLQAMLEARRAIESLQRGELTMALARLELAQEWIREIGKPEEQTDAPH